MTLIKDESILALLDRLQLTAKGWVVVDHWEGDLCAVGIAHRDHPRRLVYVSTWNKPAGRYYFERETPTGDEPTDYQSHEIEDADFGTLVSAMEAHLRPRS
jgi:hypothetical protein